MPDYKITYIFDYGQRGFTESWFKVGSTQSLNSVYDAAMRVADKRSLLLSDQCVLKAMRISNADAEGRVGKTFYIAKSRPRGIGEPDRNGMAPNVAINCVFATADDRFSKLVQLRGGWDDWEGFGGNVDKNAASLATPFNAWRAQLIADEFGFRSIFSRSKFRVTNYTVTDTGLVKCIVSHQTDPAVTLLTAAGPIGTRKVVRFARVNGKSRLNGVQVVYVTGANEVTLAKPLALGVFVIEGTMEIPSFQVRPVQNGEIQRIGSRAAGAPLLQSPGRRSAQART